MDAVRHFPHLCKNVIENHEKYSFLVKSDDSFMLFSLYPWSNPDKKVTVIFPQRNIQL